MSSISSVTTFMPGAHIAITCERGRVVGSTFWRCGVCERGIVVKWIDGAEHAQVQSRCRKCKAIVEVVWT